ncbi:hypothetical protein G8E05_06460 [Clostridium botulinum]|uniref:hypothetical protein n=1 Tax=Clostridium botulinum TaxID=1491 RepID=UPI00035BA746|nr:hypothetical protein [Clostridium botulinum]AJD28200.1 hypothetical protein T257_3139 [Clostridium botulinum CDC_297]EPS50145.1 hypothetical protein CFSAN002368_14773 [Clostridium botulinum A1 str. CFSAN002368]MBY6878390.1 hypothetical protein [Clostridium botulinum]MBY6892040.1 hypothetical protein [Clostridium botulinum]MBY6894474.1 hypothetical protein [Clostridium botulinum]
MSTLKAKKIINTINKGIELNPSTITIKQVKKVVVDGALEEAESEKNLKVLIYLEDNSNKVIVDSKTIGTSYSINKYKMIANKDCELDVNPKEIIEFDCIEGHMKVTATYPIQIENTICGYMCDLERID